MARTPLMHALQRVARAAAHESAAGAESPPGLTRRQLLRGAGGLAAAATLGLQPLRGLAAEARVAVVGAGLAGLTAAHELQKAGIASRVFEASTRLGGRCWSIRGVFDEGQIAEHGGEFIDTDHHPIRNLAAELGLQLDDVNAAQPPGAQPLYRFNGAPYTLADATADFRPVYPVLQAQNNALGAVVNYRHHTAEAIRLDRLTITQWVTRYVPGGGGSRLGQLIENAFTEENAADADQQSALNLVTVLALDKRDNFNLYYTASDQRFHVHGGNDQIPAGLAAALPGQIETGMVLVAVTQLNDGRVRLSFAKDTRIVDLVFDRVILALPFAVMRAAVDFSQAGFRPLKQRAIRSLGMGASVKLQLQFTRRVWNEVGCNGEIRLPAPDFQTSWDVTRAQPGRHGIFNFWSGGIKALVAGNAEITVLAQQCMQRAGAIIPDLPLLWNGLVTRDVWKTNPWSLGSYSYYAPGYQTAVYGIEAEPEGNCFFAGEHTAPRENVGYMNSAVETGQRAATQVASSLMG